MNNFTQEFCWHDLPQYIIPRTQGPLCWSTTVLPYIGVCFLYCISPLAGSTHSAAKPNKRQRVRTLSTQGPEDHVFRYSSARGLSWSIYLVITPCHTLVLTVLPSHAIRPRRSYCSALLRAPQVIPTLSAAHSSAVGASWGPSPMDVDVQVPTTHKQAMAQAMEEVRRAMAAFVN